MELLGKRRNELMEAIDAIQQGANADTKSTAGDKHETGLAMMHLEQEKLNRKLLEVIDTQNKFLKIDYSFVSNQVILGSLIEANDTYFLMAVALPKIEIEGKPVFGMSPQSPLGELFMGRKVNDTITFNSKNYSISEIF